MKKLFIVGSMAMLFGANAFGAVTAAERTAKRQATVNYWKTVRTALAAQGIKEGTPEMKRTERNLRQAEHRRDNLGSFYAIRGARPTRREEAARHARKAGKHVRGARKEATSKAPVKSVSVKSTAKKAAPRKGGWLSRTYEKAKAEVQKLA